MVDKIKPLKIESGSETDYLPTESDPTEDYASVKGIAFENSDNTTIRGDSGVMKFKDSVLTSEKSLNQLRTAIDNSFDNSTNSFIATNVQTAIEEARDSVAGKLMYVVSINRNSTMSNGDWFGRSEVLPNTPSYTCPRNLQLVGISWANSVSNVDFDLEFYKNGRSTTKFRTYQARNLQYGYEYNWTDSFSAGDTLDIKYIDQGDNASDMSLDLVFKAV